MNVSIIIATYGEEEWRELALSRAYPSASNQGAHEIVVGHDDEGTVSSVRNTLAEKASGEWLCFLDADDELDAGYLAAMNLGYARWRGQDGVPPLLTPAVSYVTKGHRRPAQLLPGTDLSNDNFLVVGTLVARDLFMQVGGFGEYPHGYEDWSLWAKCWKAGAKIVQVRRAVYIAYINPESKHRQAWRDHKWQVEMHNKVRADLFPEQV